MKFGKEIKRLYKFHINFGTKNYRHRDDKKSTFYTCGIYIHTYIVNKFDVINEHFGPIKKK